MMMVEARRSERVRSFLRARIIFNNRNSTIDCVVKNISATGAKIDLGDSMSIPDAFDLEIPQRGRTYRARLSWRNETAIGVEFEPDEIAAGWERNEIERLRAENRTLRLAVARLTERLQELGHSATPD